MYVPENKEELFAHLDNNFNTALEINEQYDVWMVCIDQSLIANPRLAEKYGDERQVLLLEYIKDRAKRGLKANYD